MSTKREDGTSELFHMFPNDALDENELIKALSFQAMLDRKANIEESCYGTLKWLPAKLQAVVARQHKSSWFRLIGAASSGKSVVMAEADRQLRKLCSPRTAILSVFLAPLSQGLPGQTDGMLRHALIQLILQDSTSAMTLRARAAHKCASSAEILWQLNELAILFKWAMVELTARRPVVLLVDIDEVEGTREDILIFLRELLTDEDSGKLIDHMTVITSQRPVSTLDHAPDDERLDLTDYARVDIERYLTARHRFELIGLDGKAYAALLDEQIKQAKDNYTRAIRAGEILEKCYLDGDNVSEARQALEE